MEPGPASSARDQQGFGERRASRAPQRGGVTPPNKRMKLAAGPAGTTSAHTAIRCRCNSSLSGSASRWPPFESTSVAVVGGPTAAYARVR